MLPRLLEWIVLRSNERKYKAAIRELERGQQQPAHSPVRFYGDGNTIHSTGHLDVETSNGAVVAVWFRCQTLPFKQVEVDAHRAEHMREIVFLPKIAGLDLVDPE